MSSTGSLSVSVVVPVFDGERWIRRAIDSVLAQTRPADEIVAVDDGSRDASAEVLRSFGDRVRVVAQSNRGVSAARNVGLECTRGELVAFLDQDDWWMPRKLELQVAAFEADPHVGLVHAAAVHWDDVAGCAVERFNPHPPDRLDGDVYERLLLGNAIVQSSVVVRRSVLAEVGGFDPAIAGNTVQDYDLWLRIARASRLRYLADELVVYRLHPGQAMWRVRASYVDLLAVLERHAGPAHALAAGAMRDRVARLHVHVGREDLDAGDRPAARRAFRAALGLRPSLGTAVLFAAACLPAASIRGLAAARARLRRALGRADRPSLPAWTGRGGSS